jgi:hypothetical protein
MSPIQKPHWEAALRVLFHRGGSRGHFDIDSKIAAYNQPTSRIVS